MPFALHILHASVVHNRTCIHHGNNNFILHSAELLGNGESLIRDIVYTYTLKSEVCELHDNYTKDEGHVLGQTGPLKYFDFSLVLYFL